MSLSEYAISTMCEASRREHADAVMRARRSAFSVPATLYADSSSQLSWYQTCILAEIAATSDDGTCIASNAYLAGRTKSTVRQASLAVSWLVKNDWVEIIRGGPFRTMILTLKAHRCIQGIDDG